jgi:hypothetical protein
LNSSLKEQSVKRITLSKSFYAGTVGVSAPTLDVVSGGAICSAVHRGRSNGLH